MYFKICVKFYENLIISELNKKIKYVSWEYQTIFEHFSHYKSILLYKNTSGKVGHVYNEFSVTSG